MGGASLERWHRRRTRHRRWSVEAHGGGRDADERARRAQGLDGASASAWRMPRPPCWASPAMRGAGEVEGEVRSAGGELGREGSRTATTKIGRRPHGHAHAGLGMSRVCQCRHRHRSHISVIQKEWGSRHSAPNFKIYNFAEQTFCKFESWSDQKFQKTVLVKKEGCNLGKQNIFVLAKIFPRGVGVPWKTK